jgi:hypothetical protein
MLSTDKLNPQQAHIEQRSRRLSTGLHVLWGSNAWKEIGREVFSDNLFQCRVYGLKHSRQAARPSRVVELGYQSVQTERLFHFSAQDVGARRENQL